MVTSALAALVLVLATAGQEPPGVQKAVRAASVDVKDKALADPAFATCKALLASNDLEGLPCRLAVLQAIAKATAPVSADAVKTRQALVKDALDAADYASTAQSTQPTPGRRRARLNAHRIGCATAFEAVSDLEAIAQSDPAHAAAKEVLAGTPAKPAPKGAPSAVSLRAQACACAQRTVSLAVGADASTDEQATLQGIVTSQRCLMGAGGDDLAMTGPKGPASLASGASAAVANAASPAGRLRALAESRAVEFVRCTDKATANGRISNEGRLTTCACNVMKRWAGQDGGAWALPLAKTDPKVEADMPIGLGIVVPLTVDQGTVTACGPAQQRAR